MWPPLPSDPRRLGTDRNSHYPVLNAPRAGQLNRSALRTRLGADYDADWMSIDEPYPLSGFVRRTPGADALDPDLADELRELDFSYADERGDRRAIPAAVRSIFERWLVERATSCRVRFEWHDLGVTFWPRWVKQGYCDDDDATPCSWPSGMHCRETQSDIIRLFHWQCRRRPAAAADSRSLRVKRRRRSGTQEEEGEEGEEEGEEEEDSSAAAVGEVGAGSRRRRSQKQMKCQWKRVPYPIITDCFCAAC